MRRRSVYSDRTTLIIIAGAALPLSASASNPAMVPVMPEQIEDSCGLYALADSTSMVDTYKAIQITNLDGDGPVTDADFAEWINTNIAPNLVINDVDGDGYLTAVDEVAALAVVLVKLSGDLNADGTVSFDDPALFLDLFVNPPAGATGLSDQSADVTLDGEVTADDLTAHVATATPGTQTDRVADAVKVLISFPTSLTRTFYTQGHIAAITRTWGPDRHCASTSGFDSDSDRRRYPPNHDSAVSLTWPNNHSRSVSQGWPAQHGFQVSDGWGPPGDDPDEHRYEVSSGWPANHDRDQSREWNEPPQGPHSSYTSSRCLPNHEFQQSSGFFIPPHNEVISSIIMDPDFPSENIPDPVPGHPEHDGEFSQTWVHNPATSSFFWPPNHTGTMSNTWGTHNANASQFWPTNHHAAASHTWQPDDDGNYPWWPANHARTTSEQDADPAGPPPEPGRPWWLPNLFPPGHDVSTTIQQWIPFFPD